MLDTLKVIATKLVLWLLSSAPVIALIAILIICVTVFVIKRMELKAAAEALRYASSPLRLRPCKRSQNKDTQV